MEVPRNLDVELLSAALAGWKREDMILPNVLWKADGEVTNNLAEVIWLRLLSNHRTLRVTFQINFITARYRISTSQANQRTMWVSLSTQHK